MVAEKEEVTEADSRVEEEAVLEDLTKEMD